MRYHIPGFANEYAKYRYNGLGYRIMEQRDLDESENLSNAERFYFAYDTRWRQVAVFRDQDNDPKESFIYHNAGIAGVGGSSYIDSVILRDRDANTAWTAASDATLEERRYLVQNWRADVTTMINTSGEPIEWYRYTAYGQPTSHPIADINGDGTVDSSDTAEWLDLQSGDSSGSVWLTDDLNRDDVFPSDTADDTFFYAQHAAASGLSSGYDRQSAYGLRKGYAGYEWDETLTMWHVRHRVLDSKSGKWTKRDPLGYVDGVSRSEYVLSTPIIARDWSGLRSDVCASGGSCGISQPVRPVQPQPEPTPLPSCVEFIPGGGTHPVQRCRGDMFPGLCDDPDVQRVLQEISACGCGTPKVFCQETCPADDRGRVACGLVFIDLDRCPTVRLCLNGPCFDHNITILHELIHVRDRCRLGMLPTSNCKFYLGTEFWAYYTADCRNRVQCEDRVNCACENAWHSQPPHCRARDTQDNFTRRCKNQFLRSVCPVASN